MAYLLNRNSASRIECLYALTKLIYHEFGTYTEFSLNSVKFKRERKNIFQYCTLLRTAQLALSYCPYKTNPLDDAGCALTNGVNHDTTRSKEVSNTLNSLHALGIVTRLANNRYRLTAHGKKFATTDYNTKEMQDLIAESVLFYGPCIGILFEISKLVIESDKTFKANDIQVGYPTTVERVVYKGHFVTLSTGSKKDSNTRTRSLLLTWLTAAGFIRPLDLPVLNEGEYAHYAYRNYLNKPKHNEKIYTVVELPHFFSKEERFITQRPLSYNNLTKLTGALRENNQALVREATMQYESIINNRRFAILYFLNQGYENRKPLSFNNLITFFHLHSNYFIISDNNLAEVIKKELEITNMAGIPIDIQPIENDFYLFPIAGLCLNELVEGADDTLIQILEQTEIFN